MSVVYARPKTLLDKPWHFCPGCNHGIVHRLIAEVIDEMGLREKTVGVGSVGCGVFSYNYFNFDGIGPSHGRAPAVATGVKRVLGNDRLVFTYQGDGDLAAIGTTEMVHCAVRGENITIIFINNTVYGMTGGQMAPTTLMNQVTTTTPLGRKHEHGYPFRVCEMLATAEGSAYIARVAVYNPRQINRAKRAIRKSFETQMKGEGFSMVEVLSACPTNWGMTPLRALKHVEENMVPTFPLGEFKVLKEEA